MDWVTKEYNAKRQKARQRAYRRLANQYPQEFEVLLTEELRVEGINRHGKRPEESGR